MRLCLLMLSLSLYGSMCAAPTEAWSQAFKPSSPLTRNMDGRSELVCATEADRDLSWNVLGSEGWFANKDSSAAGQPEIVKKKTADVSKIQPEYPWSIEARVGAFWPSEALIRNVYGKLEPVYAIEVERELSYRWGVWGNFDWVHKRGSSTGTHTRTRLFLSDLSAGVKYLWHPHASAQIYLGLGPDVTYVQVKNDTTAVLQKSSRFTVGLVAKSGVRFFFPHQVVADIFLDYLYAQTRFQKNTLLGGAKFGIGVGMRF